MPTIRDGRGVLTEYDMTTPPAAEGIGVIERRQGSPAPPDDVLAPIRRDTASLAASRQRANAASAAESRARGAKAGGFVKGARGPKVPLERAPTGGAAHEVVKLPRDPVERTAAVLGAVRTSSSHAEAGEKLGVGGQRVAQFVSDLRRSGNLPADVELLLRARSRHVVISPAGLTAAQHRRAIAAEVHAQDRETSVPATDADDRGTTAPPAATEVATPPGPTPEIGGGPVRVDVVVPCEGCAHVAVCSLKPTLDAWLEQLTLPASPLGAIRLGAIAIECDHFLEAVS